MYKYIFKSVTKLSPIILEDLNSIIDSDIPWQELYNKSILITGANGFLPAYIVHTLLLLNDKRKANIEVIGLVRNYENAKKRYGNYIFRKDKFNIKVNKIL